MNEVFRNLETNEVLSVSGLTNLISAEGIFSTKKTREFSAGVFGRSVPISSVISQKVFSLVFVSGDSTGTDQMKISDFFKNSDGFFRMTAPYLKNNFIDFVVVDVDPRAFNGDSAVDVLCQAKYGDFVNDNLITLYEGDIAASSSATMPAFSQSFTNGFSTIADIVLTLETENETTWKADIPIQMKKGTSSTAPMVALISGRFNDSGVNSQWIGRKLQISSWNGVEEGYGHIMPGSTTFWRLNPGETATIAIPSFTRPITASNITFNAKIQARSTQQKTNF